MSDSSGLGGIVDEVKPENGGEDLHVQPDEPNEENEEMPAPKRIPIVRQEENKPQKDEGIFYLGGDPGVYTVPGGHIVHGRYVQYHKNTKTPANVWPEIWSILTPKQREVARQKWEQACLDHPPAKVEQALAEELVAKANVAKANPAVAPAVEENYPRVPLKVGDSPPAHWDKLSCESPLFNACVARPVGKAVIKRTPAA